MHAPSTHITTRGRPRRSRVLRRRDRHIVEINVIAGMHIRTTHTSRAIRLFRTRQIAREVDKRHIGNVHQARPGICAIDVPTVLRDGGPAVGTEDLEVGEEDVADTAPAAAAWEIVAFVRRWLGDQGADPSLDVGAVVHVFIVADDLSNRRSVSLNNVVFGAFE